MTVVKAFGLGITTGKLVKESDLTTHHKHDRVILDHLQQVIDQTLHLRFQDWVEETHTVMVQPLEYLQCTESLSDSDNECDTWWTPIKTSKDTSVSAAYNWKRWDHTYARRPVSDAETVEVPCLSIQQGARTSNSSEADVSQHVPDVDVSTTSPKGEQCLLPSGFQGNQYGGPDHDSDWDYYENEPFFFINYPGSDDSIILNSCDSFSSSFPGSSNDGNSSHGDPDSDVDNNPTVEQRRPLTSCDLDYQVVPNAPIEE